MSVVSAGRGTGAGEAFPFVINAADPVRAEVGQPLPNDDELWSTTSLRNSKVLCLDWSAIGLEARDTSFDQEKTDGSSEGVASVDGALPLKTCLDKFCELETLGE